MNKPNVLVTLSHAPMGDNIINNGLWREYLRRHPGITTLKVVTWGHYLRDVEEMFRDEPRIKVYSVPDWNYCGHVLAPALKQKNTNALLLSSFGEGWGKIPGNWDEIAFKQTKIEFDHRWKSFKLSPHLLPRKPSAQTGTILIHDDPHRGMAINHRRLPVGRHVFITKRSGFWSWMNDILSAKELHMIDSSYLNLVDSLYVGLGLLRNTKLVWHAYARNSPPPIMRAPWTVLR